MKINIMIFLIISLLSSSLFANEYTCTKISVIDQRGYMKDPHWKLKYTSHVNGSVSLQDTAFSVIVPEGNKTLKFSQWKKINPEMWESRNGDSIIIKRIYKKELTFYFVDSTIPIDKEIRYLNPSHMFRLSNCEVIYD